MVPPASYKGGAMPLQIRDQMSADSMAAAKDVFRGDALAAFAGIVKDNLDEQASGEIRHLAAGVSKVDITSVAINGDEARVEVTLDVWAEFGQVHPAGDMAVAHATSQTNDVFLLQLVNGTWFVTAHTARFANGSGP